VVIDSCIISVHWEAIRHFGWDYQQHTRRKVSETRYNDRSHHNRQSNNKHSKEAKNRYPMRMYFISTVISINPPRMKTK
jgi:hypothetical protein